MTDKLLQSPLFEEIRNYLLQADENQQIFLYVPYIKTKTLSKLVDGIKNVTIITTWHMRDLVLGSSEVELYTFCKEHNYTLCVSTKLHLKVYSIALDSAIVATGNISVGGLEGGNHECGILVKELSDSDRAFLEDIKSNTTLIDEEQYQRHLERSEEILKEKSETVEYDDLITDKKREYFLRSELPMTRSVQDLLQGYGDIQAGSIAQDNEETDACIKHDLKIYNIESNLSQEELLKKLKLRFFAHPFTKKIDELIEDGAYWGEVRRWIRDHCKDVPLPRLWDLKENTQTLYHWFVELGITEDFEYVVDVPGARSERISKILKYENEVLQILESPGHTIKEIKKIYDYLSSIRSGSHLHEPTDLSEKQNASKPIWHYKRDVDEEVALMLSLSEEEIGEINSNGKLYKKIVAVIGKLHKNDFIKMWYYKQDERGTWSDGVWRLTENGKKEIQRRGLSNKIESNNETQLHNSRIVLFSVAGEAAFEHFEDTILNDVATGKFPNSEMKKLPKVRMWGAMYRTTNSNHSKWSKLQKGDILLFYRDKKYVAKMIIDGTEDNYDIAKMIWGIKDDHQTMNVQSRPDETWQLIMYSSPENVTRIDIEAKSLNKLLGYKDGFVPTRTLDFMPVRESKLQALVDKYGSIQKALASIGL